MTGAEVQAAFATAGFCGVEAEGGVVYARVTPQSPEFRAEETEAGWRLLLPWNVTPPAEAMAAWNALMGAARMELHQGEARLVMGFPGPQVLIRWAALAAEAEVHFIRWRRDRRPWEGM